VPEFLKTAKIANRTRALDADGRRGFADLILKSAGDYLDSWFGSDRSADPTIDFDRPCPPDCTRHRRPCGGLTWAMSDSNHLYPR